MVVGLKQRLTPRVDFDETGFAKLIERSPRFVWERSALCPCENANGQTRQADPDCSLCNGMGFFWFGPDGYVPDERLVGELDPVQKAVQARHGGEIIRGFFTRVAHRTDPYDHLGRWVWGSTQITVRPENLLGFYDRLTNLDDVVVYTQIIDVSGGQDRVVLRYPAIEVINLRTLADRYAQGVHFRLDGGDVLWLGGQAPSADTRLAVHYTCHPAWLVTNHPHVLRASTSVRHGQQDVETPAGSPLALPVQAEVRLEFERADG